MPSTNGPLCKTAQKADYSLSSTDFSLLIRSYGTTPRPSTEGAAEPSPTRF